jgi:hypothetical protein
MPHELQLTHTLSNSANLGRIAGVHEDNVAADIGLRIARAEPQDGTFDFMLFGNAVQSDDLNVSGYSRQTENEIFAAVEECRNEWKTNVVDRTVQVQVGAKKKFELPFQDRWDLAGEPGHLAEAVPKLALAGHKLFRLIFELNGDDNLRAVAEKLRTLLAAGPRSIAITSRAVFLPWGILYTHPVPGEKLRIDGSNWKKEGFWGYQHILQQSPESIETVNEIRPNDTGGVPFSANADERIFDDPKFKGADAHIADLAVFANTTAIRRRTKGELAEDFTNNRATLERIIYFYCHGHGSSNGAGVSLQPPHLDWPDGKVSASDFRTWADSKKLPTSPLVFINACQGGQMTTMFYQSFAVELLRQGAVALVGVQIDVPSGFASAYARRVFELFFQKGQGRRRLGPIMREVNRDMWDGHNNPLGLIYSLYRGVNCFIDWP